MTNPESAIVLFSGGQDSTTCLFWALERFTEVKAVGFDYGQLHQNELDQAAKIAALADVDFEILSLKGLMSGSSLTDHDLNVQDVHHQNADLPSTFTAGRNMLFLTVAASHGYNFGVHDLITGTCQTDFSGYPDCRQVFISSMETSLSLAMDVDFRVHTPLMYLTKAETWKLAADLSTSQFNVVEIVRTMTMTDYRGSTKMNEWGMGELDNPASELRAKGYFEAKEQGWI